MSFERVDLLKMKKESIIKSVERAVSANLKKELSDESFVTLLKILDDKYTEISEELNRYTE